MSHPRTRRAKRPHTPFCYSVEDAMRTWKHKAARDTLQKYAQTFGPPSAMSKGSATWTNVNGFAKTTVLDEAIAHAHPMKHIDFVYSTRKLKLTPEHAYILAKSSGSILVDLLKGEVTARCHFMVKNAVSIGFAEDVANNKIALEDAPAEYNRRIRNNLTPRWFRDVLGEK